MQKITRVDIYGKCSGNLKLYRKPSIEVQNALSQYKFYLSFENSRCPEYATEKAYNILNLGITDNPPVPIVMGPNKSWYNKHLPKKSFIHVDDFDNPKDLSRYLENLNSKDDLYFEYLKWRRYYKHVHDSPVHCKLCDILVNNTFKQEKRFVISDFESFWKKTDCDSNVPS